QLFALGIVEEVGELLVDLDDRQQPAECCPAAPGEAMHPRRRREIIEVYGADRRDRDHPVEYPERVKADAEARDILQESREDPGPCGFGFPLPDASEEANLVRGGTVAGRDQGGRQLLVGQWRMGGIATCPLVPPSHATAAHLRP